MGCRAAPARDDDAAPTLILILRAFLAVAVVVAVLDPATALAGRRLFAARRWVAGVYSSSEPDASDWKKSRDDAGDSERDISLE